MKKPPKGGTRDANGMIVSMTAQEQADWIEWRKSIDPRDPDDARFISLMATGERLYDALKAMSVQMEAARKLQNGGAL